MEKGTKSNITGNQLEVAVKTVLTGKGFELLNYRVWEKQREIRRRTTSRKCSIYNNLRA